MIAATFICPVDIVVIGCSVGGPQALRHIVPLLPAGLPVPVLVVQHMPDGFTALLAERLDGLSEILVREAVDGEAIHRGYVYIGKSGFELEVRRQGPRVVMQLEEPTEPRLYVPSANVTMSCAARMFGGRVLGVVLTGMGSDGAKGLLEIREAGGFTLAEDESTAVVFGMPRAAGEIGAVQFHVPLDEVVPSIMRVLGVR